MQEVAVGLWCGEHLWPISLLCSSGPTTKGSVRGAHRDIYQKTTAVESPHCDQGGRKRRVHAGAHRPPGQTTVALQRVPPAMPGSAQRAAPAGMARSVDAYDAPETVLLPAAGGMSRMR